MADCKVCEKEGKFAFEALVQGKHPVNFYRCKNCGLVYCENIHWRSEEEKTTFEKDTLKKNLYFWQLSANVICAFFDSGAKFLDSSSNGGILCRLMRDSEFNFYFDAKNKNTFAKGFEVREDDEIELICAFDCFEKAEFPVFELEKMLAKSKNILFNLNFASKKLPEIGDNDFWGFDKGEKVTFYSKKTLKIIAKKYGLKLYSRKNIHLLTEKQIGGLKFKAKMRNFELKQKLILKLLCKAPH